MPVIQLTPDFIRNITTLEGKSRTEWCDKNQPGLYCESRATSPGEGTYYLRYKDKGGKTRHFRLGTTKQITLAQARAMAKEKQAEVRLGADPSGDLRKQRAVMTFREFTEEYYLPWAYAHKRSARDDENRLRQRLLPAFGDQALNTITRKQLVEFHLSLKEIGLKGATSDHFIKIVRSMMNHAIKLDLITSNPASKIALFNEPNQVENILNETQLQDLMAVLKTDKNIMVCNIAMFLLSTGARLSEGLNAKWSEFDLPNRTWRIPATNSKSKKVRSVPLNDSLLEILHSIQPSPALRTGYLFTNPRTNDRVKTVHRAWYKIREQAGVPFLRIHDLRHMYASFMVNANVPIYTVSQVLGHSSTQVTQRYAHLSTETLQAAATAASDRILAASPKRPAPALKLVI